jgi:hypothetical protein
MTDIWLPHGAGTTLFYVSPENERFVVVESIPYEKSTMSALSSRIIVARIL